MRWVGSQNPLEGPLVPEGCRDPGGYQQKQAHRRCGRDECLPTGGCHVAGGVNRRLFPLRLALAGKLQVLVHFLDGLIFPRSVPHDLLREGLGGLGIVSDLGLDVRDFGFFLFGLLFFLLGFCLFLLRFLGVLLGVQPVCLYLVLEGLRVSQDRRRLVEVNRCVLVELDGLRTLFFGVVNHIQRGLYVPVGPDDRVGRRCRSGGDGGGLVAAATTTGIVVEQGFADKHHKGPPADTRVFAVAVVVVVPSLGRVCPGEFVLGFL
mmetsp:Transcript_11885/g.25115  ORF Transcript_11885/g.25115 Transcript_11885/m.25115 type:complete len:263 (-) Transcript_11885:671-1459(-)